MKYRIGLDIGIASVGWSVIENDENDKPKRIVDLGVRTFTSAEKPKDGSSLAVERREARGLRRRLRRRAFRLELAKKFLQKNLLNGKVDNNINRDIYKLRNDALESLISNEELYSVILHFIKHRGFKSNRKSESASSENGQVLSSIEKNQKYIAEKGYRTIGEAIYKDEKFYTINSNGQKEYKVRNHGTYENCFLRNDLEYELKYILDKQAAFGNEKIDKVFIDVVLEIFNKQRSIDEGPNEPSKYKANFAVGKCIFEKDEYRAPKGSFTFEYFNALQKLNHLNIVKDNVKRKLSKEEVENVLSQLLKGKDLKYKDLRKILNLENTETFTGLTYFVKTKEKDKKPTFEEVIQECEKSRFFEFKFSKSLSKVLGLDISTNNSDLFDAIGLIFSMRKSDKSRVDALRLEDSIVTRLTDEQQNQLKRFNPESEVLDKLLSLEPKEFGNLSIKAMKKIVPHLEQGCTYNEACTAVGYDFNNAYGNAEKKLKIKWSDLTEELQEITSPVVLRSISQTIKVVNAIIDKYGSPSAIFVEVAREMSKNFIERRKILKDNETRKQDNERIEKLIREMGIIPTAQDIVKYRLFMEQDGKCVYSGQSFDKVLGGVKAIFENNNTQIDHIIPYSKCYDDSYNNKVLVLSNENQLKGNRLPYQYMDKEKFEKFSAFVTSTYKNNHKKVQNLLKKEINEEESKELNSRALNDTKHASKFVMNMFENHLAFAESSLKKKPVRAVKGAMTSYLRKIWGLTKVRFENDRHHALDATVVACCTNDMIQKVSRYLQFKEFYALKNHIKLLTDGENNYYVDVDGVRYTEDEFEEILKKPKPPQPYEHFSNELKHRLGTNPINQYAIDDYVKYGYTAQQIADVKEVFVSRMPTRGVKGPIHKQTIRRIKEKDSVKYTVTKTALENLKYEKGEIVGYPKENIVSDPLLYNALIKRIEEYKVYDNAGKVSYDIKTAFKTPFYKPKANGENGPLVKTVKIEEKVTDYVELKNKSGAANTRMVRIDVFTKNNKNYIVPVYVSDVYKGVLPNKAVAVHKAKSDWLEMDDTFIFKFSIYPNDLIFVKSKGELKGHYSLTKKPTTRTETFGYYKGMNISNNGLDFETIDKEILFEGVGAQNVTIEKYVVDVLGNISKVKREDRQPISFKKKK